MSNSIVENARQDQTFEAILMSSMKVPIVNVKRDVFLRKELRRYCKEDVIQEAIRSNPAKAGISKNTINKISKSVINYEASKAAFISVAASLPSSITAAAAVGASMADITSYFAFILRTVQELAYLYGFEQFDFSEDSMDSETMNSLLVFIGVMFGVQGAAGALSKIANSMSTHVAQKLSRQALTKGAIYPIVKKVASSVGQRMTKQIFADAVASGIPALGGVVSGGLTWVMFRPGCMKLREHLMSYNLCDPNYYTDNEVIDIEYDLSRFHKAQERDYETALAEIRDGQKRSHWMWYIFPQLKGLGHSNMADIYGIRDMEEAEEYLADPVLRYRLIEISSALLNLETNDATEILGYTNQLKLRSCMTLFALADPTEETFRKVLDKFYKGEMDKKTLMLLDMVNVDQQYNFK